MEKLGKNKKGIKLCTLNRCNSKTPLPNPSKNLISKFRHRIESTFSQLVEYFEIERARVNSIIVLLTSLEVKFLCFNILTYIISTTAISNILNFN